MAEGNIRSPHWGWKTPSFRVDGVEIPSLPSIREPRPELGEFIADARGLSLNPGPLARSLGLPSATVPIANAAGYLAPLIASSQTFASLQGVASRGMPMLAAIQSGDPVQALAAGCAMFPPHGPAIAAGVIAGAAVLDVLAGLFENSPPAPSIEGVSVDDLRRDPLGRIALNGDDFQAQRELRGLVTARVLVNRAATSGMNNDDLEELRANLAQGVSDQWDELLRTRPLAREIRGACFFAAAMTSLQPSGQGLLGGNWVLGADFGRKIKRGIEYINWGSARLLLRDQIARYGVVRAMQEHCSRHRTPNYSCSDWASPYAKYGSGYRAARHSDQLPDLVRNIGYAVLPKPGLIASAGLPGLRGHPVLDQDVIESEIEVYQDRIEAGGDHWQHNEHAVLQTWVGGERYDVYPFGGGDSAAQVVRWVHMRALDIPLRVENVAQLGLADTGPISAQVPATLNLAATLPHLDVGQIQAALAATARPPAAKKKLPWGKIALGAGLAAVGVGLGLRARSRR